MHVHNIRTGMRPGNKNIQKTYLVSTLSKV